MPRRSRGSFLEDACCYRCCWSLCCCCGMCCFSWDTEYIGNPEEKCGFCEILTFVYALIEYWIPFSVMSILLWLLLRPDNLRPQVDAAVFVGFSLDNATSWLDYDIAMDLNFLNRHRYLDVRYLELIAVASYGGTRLGPSVDVLAIFVQRPGASIVVHTTFQGSATPLAPAAAELFAWEATDGSFKVLVMVASTFMYKFPFLGTVVYYYDHKCYIRFPAWNGSVTPPAAVFVSVSLLSDDVEHPLQSWQGESTGRFEFQEEREQLARSGGGDRAHDQPRQKQLHFTLFVSCVF